MTGLSEQRQQTDHVDLVADYAALTSIVRELVTLMEQAGLRRLEVAQGSLHIVLEAAEQRTPPASAAPLAPAPSGAAPASSATEDPALYTVRAPLVGTFYAAPSPDAEPFVQVGDHVEAGQTIGIISAMKVMNEITTEYAGTVIAILVENGQAVEYGQPLIQIRRDSAG